MVTRVWCSHSPSSQTAIWPADDMHRSEESITIQIYLYKTWKVVLLSLLVRINTHNRSTCSFNLRHFSFHGSFHVCFLEEAQLHFSFVIALKSGRLRMYSTFLPIQVNFPVTSTISSQQQYSEHSPGFDRHNCHTSTYNKNK
jgi:hypothetical protein